jgi:nucleotide-binding universal stress UspA family protein
METILCPTDFSPASTNALQYADQLAHWMQARLVLFHNIYEPAMPAHQSFGGVLYEEPIRDPGHRQALLDRLEAWKEKLAGAGGSQPVPYESQVRYGETEDNIAAAALAHQAALVVLGSKHSEGLKQLLKGSVVDKVIRQAPCPVLIIPPHTVFKPLNRIVYASGLVGEAGPEAGFMARLAAMFQARILFLHILPEYSARDREQAEAAYEVFSHQLPATPTTFHLETHANIGEGISQFTQRHQADLLVMGYHPQRSWERFLFVNYTRKMAAHADLPLLIIHQ